MQYTKWLALIALLTLCSFSQAQRRIIPHVTSPTGGFETRIILSNPRTNPEFYELVSYDLQGIRNAIISGELGPGATLFRTVPELFGTTAVSHFTIIDFSGVEVTAVYQAVGNAKAPAHSRESRTQATTWRIYPGNKNVTWDGAAIVNMGVDPVQVRLQSYDENGTRLSNLLHDQIIPSAGKALLVLSDIFESGAYYEIVSTQPLALTALRGDKGGSSTYLWENAAVAIQQPEVAVYEVDIDLTWSLETHGESGYPEGLDAHLSHFGGGSHNSRAFLWKSNELASPGMVTMAETGFINVLADEVRTMYFNGDFIYEFTRHFPAPGKVTIEIAVRRTHPLVTMVSMIAPSPDWFTGVQSLNMRDSNGWRDEVVVDLLPFDGGTRLNNTWELFGPQNLPPAPVKLIETAPLGGKTLGTITFRLTSVF